MPELAALVRAGRAGRGRRHASRRGDVDRRRWPGVTEARREIDCAAEDLELLARSDGRLVTADDDEWPLLAFTAFAGMDHAAATPGASAAGAVGRRARPASTTSRERAAAIVGTRACTAYGEHVAADLAAGLVERDVDGGVGRRIRHRRCRAPRDAGRRRVHRCGARRRYRRALPVRPRRAAAPDRSGGAGGQRVPARRASGPPSVPDPQPAGRRTVGRDRGRRGRRPQRRGQHRGVGARRWVARCVRCPGPVTSSASVGCHALLRDGANLVTRAAEVVELIGHIGELAPDEERPDSLLDGLGEAEQRVYDALPARGRAHRRPDRGGLGASADAGARTAVDARSVRFGQSSRRLLEAQQAEDVGDHGIARARIIVESG